MPFTVDQRNAAFTALKAKLQEIIDAEAGFFASTIKGDIKDQDVLTLVDTALNATEGAK